MIWMVELFPKCMFWLGEDDEPSFGYPVIKY